MGSQQVYNEEDYALLTALGTFDNDFLSETFFDSLGSLSPRSMFELSSRPAPPAAEPMPPPAFQDHPITCMPQAWGDSHDTGAAAQRADDRMRGGANGMGWASDEGPASRKTAPSAISPPKLVVDWSRPMPRRPLPGQQPKAESTRVQYEQPMRRQPQYADCAQPVVPLSYDGALQHIAAASHQTPAIQQVTHSHADAYRPPSMDQSRPYFHPSHPHMRETNTVVPSAPHIISSSSHESLMLPPSHLSRSFGESHQPIFGESHQPSDPSHSSLDFDADPLGAANLQQMTQAAAAMAASAEAMAAAARAMAAAAAASHQVPAADDCDYMAGESPWTLPAIDQFPQHQTSHQQLSHQHTSDEQSSHQQVSHQQLSHQQFSQLASQQQPVAHHRRPHQPHPPPFHADNPNVQLMQPPPPHHASSAVPPPLQLNVSSTAMSVQRTPSSSLPAPPSRPSVTTGQVRAKGTKTARAAEESAAGKAAGGTTTGKAPVVLGGTKAGRSASGTSKGSWRVVPPVPSCDNGAEEWVALLSRRQVVQQLTCLSAILAEKQGVLSELQQHNKALKGRERVLALVSDVCKEQMERVQHPASDQALEECCFNISKNQPCHDDIMPRVRNQGWNIDVADWTTLYCCLVEELSQALLVPDQQVSAADRVLSIMDSIKTIYQELFVRSTAGTNFFKMCTQSTQGGAIPPPEDALWLLQCQSINLSPQQVEDVNHLYDMYCAWSGAILRQRRQLSDLLAATIPGDGSSAGGTTTTHPNLDPEETVDALYRNVMQERCLLSLVDEVLVYRLLNPVQIAMMIVIVYPTPGDIATCLHAIASYHRGKRFENAQKSAAAEAAVLNAMMAASICDDAPPPPAAAAAAADAAASLPDIIPEAAML